MTQRLGIEYKRCFDIDSAITVQPRTFDLVAILCAAMLSLFLVMNDRSPVMAKLCSRRQASTLIRYGLICGLLVGIPLLRELLRGPYWFPEIRQVWQTLWHDPRPRLHLVKTNYGTYYLMLLGPSYANTITDIQAKSESMPHDHPYNGAERLLAPIPANTDYIFLQSNCFYQYRPNIFKLEQQLSLDGWERRAHSTFTMLFARRTSSR